MILTLLQKTVLWIPPFLESTEPSTVSFFMAIFLCKFLHKIMEKHLWFSKKEKRETIDFQTNIYYILPHSVLLLKACSGYIKPRQLLNAVSFFKCIFCVCIFGSEILYYSHSLSSNKQVKCLLFRREMLYFGIHLGQLQYWAFSATAHSNNMTLVSHRIAISEMCHQL